MSMRKNRNIRTLPLENLALFNHPPPEASSENLIFGEEISKANSPIFERTYILSSDDSLDAIITGVRDLGTDKSSSSSLSWGEEYKSEASKHVRDELERMERVLQGLEPIPPNYDEEEYKEWMDFFPNLCVIGTGFGTPVKQFECVSHLEEIIAVDPDDSDRIETHNQIKNKIKKAVVDQIYEKISNKAPKITLNLDESIDIDNYLKISPLGGASREPFVRRRSSKSLISSQISSSKWLKDDNDYNSLPFVVGNVKSVQSITPKGILKNTLVLPPIETSQFRSISATPRRESKSMSALSENGRVSDRLETSNFFVINNSGFRRGSGRGRGGRLHD